MKQTGVCLMHSHKPTAAIVDYGMGNLFSVKRACDYAGINGSISNDKHIIAGADALILPGVGAFGDAMDNLGRLDLIAPIKDFIAANKPFLGICLGMQLLMTQSEEFGVHQGLNVFAGSVVRLGVKGEQGKKIKIPQVGWNRILKAQDNQSHWDDSLLKGIPDGEFMYFVHSFHVVPDSKDIILSITEYEGFEYVSSVKYKNIFACQFHPEKSSFKGLQIYKNFAVAINDFKERDDKVSTGMRV